MAEVGLAPSAPTVTVTEAVGGSGERRFLPPRNLATDAEAEDGVRFADGVPTPSPFSGSPGTAGTIQIVPFLAQLLAQEQIELEDTQPDSNPVVLRDGLLAYRIAKGIGLDPEADAPDDDTIIHRGPTSLNLTL